MPDLIQTHGHPTTDPILGARPFAQPGIYVLAAAAASICDWFDTEADAGFRSLESGQTFLAATDGGFRALETGGEFRGVAGPGWRVKKPCA